jgi:hypothetical protein
LVIFNVSIEVSAAHGIRVVLVGNWAILAHTRMPGRDHAFPHNAPVVRSEAVIMCVISSKTPAADLLQETVIFVMVG